MGSLMAFLSLTLVLAIVSLSLPFQISGNGYINSSPPPYPPVSPPPPLPPLQTKMQIRGRKPPPPPAPIRAPMFKPGNSPPSPSQISHAYIYASSSPPQHF
ncbi:hypothetical protein Lalb_Chr23g0276641 [Lupinus albus]|uniref:Uncharacterized protein n=1 Tax=Lupinus albus TaxID=3870 RepID=A0A6A4NJK3_LUPAL|nr:hypothetical protein Lalb_Chr23g0276641 [Lupinus albus]